MKKMKVILILILVCIVSIAIVSFLYINDKYDKTEIIVTTEEIELKRKVNAEDNLTDDEIINMLFENKVFNEECNKREIKLEDSVLNEINSELQEELTEDDLKAIELWDMTETEFYKYSYDTYVNLEKQCILDEQIIDEIDNNNLKNNNRELKKKVDDFNKNRDSMPLGDIFNTFDALYNEYVEILKSDYVLKVE